MQSNTALNRDFYIKSSMKLAKLLNAAKNDCIFKMMKSFYDVSETSNHWFETYHCHHTDQFEMIEFTYDFCLLYRHGPFGIVKFQIDDTLMLTDETFAAKKKMRSKNFWRNHAIVLFRSKRSNSTNWKLNCIFLTTNFFTLT